MSQRTAAIIINHCTAVFAEVTLRTLAACISPPGVTVDVTVVNNPSDENVADLRSAADAFGARFVESRWPVDSSGRHTHGDVLRDFVLENEEADRYLFLDSDLVFTDIETLVVMENELSSRRDAWANHARLVSLRTASEDDVFRGAVAFFRRNREVAMTSQLAFGDLPAKPALRHSGTVIPGCEPTCVLIRNNPLFLNAAKHIGFSRHFNFSLDPGVGGWGDTLALQTQVMKAGGWRLTGSSSAVVHFQGASHWFDEVRERDAVTCERLVAMLRAGAPLSDVAAVFPDRGAPPRA